MERVVKSIRIREEIWELVRQISKEQNKPIAYILEDALEKYISEIFKEKAVKKLQSLPTLHLGEEPFTREEIYEDRC